MKEPETLKKYSVLQLYPQLLFLELAVQDKI